MNTIWQMSDHDTTPLMYAQTKYCSLCLMPRIRVFVYLSVCILCRTMFCTWLAAGTASKPFVFVFENDVKKSNVLPDYWMRTNHNHLSGLKMSPPTYPPRPAHCYYIQTHAAVPDFPRYISVVEPSGGSEDERSRVLPTRAYL